MRGAARIGVSVGAGLIGLGVLALAFVAYQFWGTALYEEHAQSNLKSELSHELHRSLPNSAANLTDAQRLGLPALARVTAPTRQDPAVGQPVGLLSIPKMGVLDAIVEGVGEAQLEQGPGHYPGTSLPGQAGNVAIAGHRTTYAHPFYNLDALAPGDNIYILTAQGLFQYTVSGSQIVAPTDVAVLNANPGKSTLTLTTCNPRYSAATRLVVTASFDGQGSGQPTTSPTTKHTATQLAGESKGSALGGARASVTSAVLWGFLTVALIVATVLVGRHASRRLRTVLVVVAIPVVSLSLLVCFEHVSLALPGSF